MMRKLIYLLGLTAILFSSCSSGGDSSGANENNLLVKRTIKTYAGSGNVYTVDHT